MENKNSLVEDLLTENRFWTFWSSDWSKKVYVYWGGKTSFKKIIEQISKLDGMDDFVYERQVSLKSPDLKFD